MFYNNLSTLIEQIKDLTLRLSYKNQSVNTV